MMPNRQRVNRLPPALPAQHMKTYGLIAPQSTHFRDATCEEVNCPNLIHGWQTFVDEATDLGQRQAYAIRSLLRMNYTEAPGVAGGTVFTFPPGQQCFEQHRVPLEREPLYVVRDGDWRGNPRGTPVRQHDKPEHWVEDFGEHQDGIARVRERG